MLYYSLVRQAGCWHDRAHMETPGRRETRVSSIVYEIENRAA